MSRVIYRLDGLGWPYRNGEILRRLSHLIVAGNIRVFRASPRDADWSSYQYSVACSMLGLDAMPKNSDEQPVVATRLGTWELELGVVMDAMLEVLDEFELEEDEEDERA